MIRQVAVFALGLTLLGCNSENQDTVGASLRDSYANEGVALEKAGCIFEDQPLCAHLIEKRTEFNLLLSPHTKNIPLSKKEKAARILRDRVSEAGSSMSQCRKGFKGNSIVVVKGIKLRAEPITVFATAPLDETSGCFIVRNED